MKKFLSIFAVVGALVMGSMALVANATPTSTIVQNLVITGVKSAPCLGTDGNGLVGSTLCGSGGGSTTTFNNIATSTLLVKAGAGVGVVSSTDGTGQAIITISATGGASSTIVTGVSPIVVNQVGINATTSCPTCIVAAVQTLFGLSTSSISISTGTQASTFTVTSTGGNTIKIIIPSNVGFFTNDSGYLTGNQTITLTGAVTGSGATSITTTYTTSTLYSLFSGSGPIVFNTSTGGISFVNPGYLTAAITSINGSAAASHNDAVGAGLSLATSSSGGNSTSTFTNTGVTSAVAGGCVTVSNATGTVTFGSTCLTSYNVTSGNPFLTISTTTNSATITATSAYVSSIIAGTNVTISNATGSVTINSTGGGGSSTVLNAGAGWNVTALSGSNQTGSLDTTYAASWSALETFLKGATINGTTTLASTTNALILTNGSGTVLTYAGSSCGGGQAPNGFSATGTVTGCLTFLTANQTITLTGAVTGSGATTIATTFTTSTLYGLFSNTATGLTYSTTTGATSLTAGYFIPLTASGTQWNAAFASSSLITSALGSNAFNSTAIPTVYVSTFNGQSNGINYNVIGTGNVTTTLATSGGNSTTTVALTNSGVASGTYTNTNLTVSSSGIITAASNGSAGNPGTVTTSSAGTANTLPIWTSGSALGNSHESESGTSTFINASATYIGSSNTTSTSALIWVSNYTGGGYWDATGTIPTLSSCGTGATSTGNQWRGRVVPGSGSPSACTITWPVAFKNTPSCIVDEESLSLTNALSFTAASTTLLVSQTGLGTFDFDCVAQSE